MTYGKRMDKRPEPVVFPPSTTQRRAKTGAMSTTGSDAPSARGQFEPLHRLVELGPNPDAPEATVFNVLDYGAKGDGVAIENEAINLAIAAAVEAGGGTVYFPAGTYLINDTVHLVSAVNLAGEGMDCAIIKMTVAGIMFDGIFGVAEAARTTYRDLMLQGNNLATVGMDLAFMNYVHIYRLNFRGFITGVNLRLTECFWPYIFGCYFQNSTCTMIELAESTNGCNQTQIVGNEFLLGTSGTALIVNGQNVVIRDNDFEGGSGGDIAIDLRHVEGVFIQSNYIELWDDHAITMENAVTECKRIVIENNVLNISGSGTICVELNGAGATIPNNIIVRSNRFSDMPAATAKCINIGNATRVRHHNNDPDIAKLTENWVAAQQGPDTVVALTGTATFDPASIGDGVVASVLVTVTGAKIGNPCAVGFSANAAGNDLLWSAYVQADDTVRVTFMNKTGGALNLGSGTVTVHVFRTN